MRIILATNNKNKVREVGVSLEYIPELRSMGFGGAAVLGALWQAKEPTRYLKALMEA